jgi:hypothetical protein
MGQTGRPGRARWRPDDLANVTDVHGPAAGAGQAPVIAVASGKGGVGKSTVAVENMSGQVCPSCGETTQLFPAAPPHDSIWGLVPKLASVPFSAIAARDADQGMPVLVTGAVPAQVAAYEVLAARVRQRIAGTGAAPG